MEISTMEKLKIIMDRRGLTFSDVAKITGKTPQAISQSFKSDNVSLNRIEEIAEAIGVKMIVEFEEI